MLCHRCDMSRCMMNPSQTSQQLYCLLLHAHDCKIDVVKTLTGRAGGWGMGEHLLYSRSAQKTSGVARHSKAVFAASLHPAAEEAPAQNKQAPLLRVEKVHPWKLALRGSDPVTIRHVTQCSAATTPQGHPQPPVRSAVMKRGPQLAPGSPVAATRLLNN